jgi:hypothetical protein
MAAAIKALNAKIRSNKYSDYFCSTRTFYQSLPDCGLRMREVGSEEEVDDCAGESEGMGIVVCMRAMH